MIALAEPMAGENCTALPFSEDHRAALKAACGEDADIWPIYSVSCDPTHFDGTIDALLARPDAVTFVLFDGDELAGMSSFLRIDERNKVLEIGFTYYRPPARGTGLNRRVKDMMIRRAFDVGFRRIEFRVDRRNLRSQAACRKLGFVREGIRRADTITWTGHVRDTVMFSVLPGEWPV
ncbi:GNAT family N-acetyltransferase [Sphingomonas sp. KRR8]|uniref:GNAT family N-acetyltransferase n=1 Tax=Sphingomonas sp. KRR8 TaxID=2942996 RepID=UPI002020F25D|nr:GNAT family protein [Sphingomonas sp. KRR8]URD60984.1 GNAT family N-acetyltransferase [Sphingomonas sp. KRR8]